MERDAEGDAHVHEGPDAATRAATTLAVALADAVSAPVVVHGHDLTPAASIGVALYPADGEDFAALLRTADRRRTAGKGTRQR